MDADPVSGDVISLDGVFVAGIFKVDPHEVDVSRIGGYVVLRRRSQDDPVGVVNEVVRFDPVET